MQSASYPQLCKSVRNRSVVNGGLSSVVKIPVPRSRLPSRAPELHRSAWRQTF